MVLGYGKPGRRAVRAQLAWMVQQTRFASLGPWLGRSRRASAWLRSAVAMAAAGWLGCGAEAAPLEAPPSQPATEGQEATDGPSGMAVTGIMGVIPERHIQRTLEGKLGRFQRCFFDGMERVEFLGGAVEFYFRVGAGGAVETVFLKRSNVGDRGTERCLLARASEARFPAPRGGDAAEFAWGFELDPPDGVRPPVDWSADRVDAIREAARAGLAECGVGKASVTAYVQPGGGVLSVGLASDDALGEGPIDCAIERLAALAFPDPGSYPAKVTFALP